MTPAQAPVRRGDPGPPVGYLAAVVDAEVPRRRRPLRRIVVVLAVLVVLGAVLLGGAGWYYAGEIYSGALAVDPGPRGLVPDTVVTSLDGGRAVLDSTADDDPLRRPETEGLVWQGGAGVVSGAPEVGDDGSVARSLEVVAGSPPTPGTPADLRGDVWTDPNAAYGVAYEDVDVDCPRGSCPAWFVPGDAGTWLIAVHGKGGSRREGLRALGPAVAQGMPGLLITYRNDPEAPADPSGQYGYGATEWHDLEAAVGYALDHGARSVVLYGASMGGGIVAAFLQHSDLRDRVDGVVLDAPMLDLAATVDHGAAQRRLPLLGTAVPDVLTGTAEWIAGWRYDLDWAAVDYLPADWLDVPALVFHGTDDDTVPISTSDELAADRPDLVHEVRVPGAGHVRAWNTDPAAYERVEGNFLRCLLAGPSPACATG
jgi:pimeloyl-ACP methyl ester carboxylesterase